MQVSLNMKNLTSVARVVANVAANVVVIVPGPVAVVNAAGSIVLR
ncbi:MAG TPA: hypothetical protein VFH07_12365 [Chitinophagaceae bacterium]|jgi:hypothetical protein|nr:hypothetical protein [Chitinophagaceae bacterium]